MYEPRHHRPLPRRHFIRRLLAHVAAALALILGSLLIGMAGYSCFEGLAWRDAFLNAAMLLGGMGPVESPRSDGGKIFAGLYALYAGLMFIVVAGVVLAPVAHRMLHLFHWDLDESESKSRGAGKPVSPRPASQEPPSHRS